MSILHNKYMCHVSQVRSYSRNKHRLLLKVFDDDFLQDPFRIFLERDDTDVQF